jgi:hypothetical protein
VPGSVAATVGDIVRSPPEGPTFARPKSRILMRPSRVTKMFSGLRSRCTILLVGGRETRDLDAYSWLFARASRVG